MLSLSIFAFLTTYTTGSTYYVSSSPEADYKCLDDTDGTCTIHCDQAVTTNTHLETSFDCGHNKECYFYCDERNCAENVHIIATNSSNLHVIVGINGEECMSGSVIDTPKSGNATFDMGNSIKGLAGMTVNAGSNAQNIIITAESTNIAGDDCKGMQLHTATAEYVEISLGSGIKWENGVLQCPAITERYNAAKNITPCMLYASNAILMNTHIIANDGIPTNVWISPGVIYMGINTLTCDGATSIAPFDMNSECWLTSEPLTTFYPSSTNVVNSANVTETIISYTDSVDEDTETSTTAITYVSDEDAFASLFQHVTATSAIIAALVLLVCCCGCVLCHFVRRKRQLHAQLFAKVDVVTDQDASPHISANKINITANRLSSKSYPVSGLSGAVPISSISPRSPISSSMISRSRNSGSGLGFAYDTYLSSPGEASMSVPHIKPPRPILTNINSHNSVGSYQHNFSPGVPLQVSNAGRRHSEWHKYQYQQAQLQRARAMQQQQLYAQTPVYTNSQSYNSQTYNHSPVPLTGPLHPFSFPLAPLPQPPQPSPPPQQPQPQTPVLDNSVPPPPPLEAPPPPPPLRLSVLSDGSYACDTDTSLANTNTNTETESERTESDAQETENGNGDENEIVILAEEIAAELHEKKNHKIQLKTENETDNDNEYEYEYAFEEDVDGGAQIGDDEKELFEEPKMIDCATEYTLTYDQDGKLQHLPNESTATFIINMTTNEGGSDHDYYED